MVEMAYEPISVKSFQLEMPVMAFLQPATSMTSLTRDCWIRLVPD